MPSAPHDRFASALVAALDADGGLAMGAGQPAEPEPTAVAALALGSGEAAGRRCRDWLLAAQHADGGFSLDTGRVENSAPTPLIALALPDGEARERALDYAVARHALVPAELEGTPLAWGWTPTTFAWTEPTARVLLAMRVARPDASATIEEAEQMLAARECVDGGWNYGNRDAQGTDLKPYVQTTAVAVMALQGSPADLATRGRRFLVDHWRDEPGGLTLAQTLVALRVTDEAAGSALAGALTSALGEQYDRTGFLGNLLSVAWATLATAPDARLAALRGAGS